MRKQALCPRQSAGAWLYVGQVSWDAMPNQVESSANCAGAARSPAVAGLTSWQVPL